MSEDKTFLEEVLSPFHAMAEIVQDSYHLLKEQEKRRLQQPVFYNKSLTDGPQFTLDDKERDRVFIWSPVNFLLNIVSPVNVSIPINAGSWQDLGFNSGTAYTTTGLASNTTIVFKCTNSLVV